MKEQTKDIGFAKVYEKIKSRGVAAISSHKSGNKRTIIFTTENKDEFYISTRAKTRGTWQTSIDYGALCEEKPDEREYWIFVDVSDDEPDFYIVPLWWIKNDIHKHHSEYLEKHGGRRALTEQSKHHAINQPRISHWRNKWQLIGL